MEKGFLSIFSPSYLGRSIRQLLYANPLYRLTLKGGIPEKLRLSPPAFRLANPETGRKIIDGTYTLSRHLVELGEKPWDNELDNAEQLADLHSFSWLPDLCAVGTVEARSLGCRLLADWIDYNEKWQDFSWRSDILGERLTKWLYCFDFLTAKDAATRKNLLKMTAIQARHLVHCSSHAPNDAQLFKAIQGLIFSTVCLPGAESSIGRSLDRLDSAIGRQILPDGGHIERNPSMALELLSRLNQIKELLLVAHIEIPIQLQGAIDRMPPMVRALRLGDGCLSQFNGGCEEERNLIDTVLAETGVRGKALTSAPHSGFQRFSAGRTLIIVDTGKPFEAERLSSHAGTLSFEMSHGKDRLVVNCGTPNAAGKKWLTAMRVTAAHSTLSVDDLSSSQFDKNKLTLGPKTVECRRSEADGAVWLETSHDGYLNRVGIIHKRNLFLASSGEDFRGEDIIEGPNNKDFTIRFHLHPNVQVSQAQGLGSVLIKLNKGVGWKFQASGGTITIKESVYLNGLDEPRRTNQIVISGSHHGDRTEIKWRFHKL